MLVGLSSSVILVISSPNVWNPEPGAAMICRGALFPLGNPTIFTVPLGFLGAYSGTILSSEKVDEEKYAEVVYRSNTGHGVSSAENH